MHVRAVNSPRKSKGLQILDRIRRSTEIQIRVQNLKANCQSLPFPVGSNSWQKDFNTLHCLSYLTVNIKGFLIKLWYAIVNKYVNNVIGGK